MRDGFIKCAAAAPAIRVADCAYNKDQILAEMKKAHALGVKLLVLPELCITGASCGDLFFQPTLLEGAKEALLCLAEESAGTDMLTVVGAPLRWEGRLYSCACVLQNGSVLGIVPKSTLSCADLNQLRHFAPAPEGCAALELEGAVIPFGKGLLFRCDEKEAFTFGVELGEDLAALRSPACSMAERGAAVICCPAADCELVGKALRRRTAVAAQSARLCAGYIFANAGRGESTTDAVYAGHRLIAENGVLLAEAAPFSGEMAITDIDVDLLANRRLQDARICRREGDQVMFSLEMTETPLTRKIPVNPFVPEDQGELAARCEDIVAMQAHALAARISHARCKTAVVGISGGLDSCLALLVAVKAMDILSRPRTDVIAITMPCFGTTGRTRSNAETLTLQLGATLRHINITQSVTLHLADIGHDISVTDVTYENAQARERTQVLMDVANDTGGMVVGTGDLSELALGWATYNGDHMSMYGVNGSVPKTLMRHIVAHIARTCGDAALEKVLLDILDTPVSPELLPAKDGEIAQKTEDLVGPYELHDFYLYHILRRCEPPKKVLRLAMAAFDGVYDRETLLKWLKNFYRRFFIQQFKRSCLPDGPKVGTVSLSPRGGWQMPSDAVSALWLAELETL